MKHIWITFLTFAFLLSACAAPVPAIESDTLLVVSDGAKEKTYSLSDLEAMPSSEAPFNKVRYIGVSLPALLQVSGYDPAAVKAVKVVASDGYSVNYDPAIFTRDDVIVAYAQAEGALAEEDGALRIVLPGGEGKLNVRMLTKVEVVQ